MKRKPEREITPPVEIIREAKGQFAKGASPNPGGRSKSEREVVEAARAHGVKIIERLAEMFFEDGNLYAGVEILNRAYGRAKQKVELTGEDGGAVRVEAVREVLAARFTKLLAAEAKAK